MAIATVKLIGSESYDVRGYKFTKGQTRIITNDDDIKLFRYNPLFKTTVEQNEVVVAQQITKPSAKESVANETTDNGPPPWKRNMSKVQLLKAAEARGIAVTSEDKVAVIVQMLTEHDNEVEDESDDEDDDGDDE